MRRTLRNLQFKRPSRYAIFLLVYLALSSSWWNDSHPTPCDSKVGHPSGFACALPVRVRKPERDGESSSSTSSKLPTLDDGGDENSNDVVRQEEYQRKLISLNKILVKAGKKGLGGGIPGAIAGIVQVVTLMWLRTIINYQSRYGTPFFKSIGILYREGGISRFYRGLSFALFQAPLSRFVSTAANDGVEALLTSFDVTREWGEGLKVGVASIVVGLMRMMLMPLDTCKTVLQVDSVEGFRNLMRRVRNGKISVLYQGAVANAVSSIMGHYPWFFTYNTLSRSDWVEKLISSKLIRNAWIGLTASVVSDTVVNAARVVKTTKQAVGSKHDLSYGDAIRMIVAADGWKGLFGRGLRTRIFANSLQSIVFTVIWRGLADKWGNRSSADDSKPNRDPTTEEESPNHGGHETQLVEETSNHGPNSNL